MQLRSKKAIEIKGFLSRPQTLKPKLNLDINVEEYIKQYRKYLYYRDYHFNTYNSDVIKTIHYNRGVDTFTYMATRYKNPANVVEADKFITAIETYNKLKDSEMYDSSICKMCLLEIQGNYYLAIHFPKLFLTEANSDREPVEIRDIYFYLDKYNLYAFRTTVDVVNPKFIHPHVSGNFGSYCLGSSPLSMSLNNLYYNLDIFTDDDVDIFWVNFYRTVTQKTELGDHYYSLNRLDEATHLEWRDFLELIYVDEEFMSSLPQYIQIINLTEEIHIAIDSDAIKKDFFTLLSYEHNSKIDKKEDLEKAVRIDDVPLKNKRLTSIYKSTRKVYGNMDYLLEALIKEACPNSVIDVIYDDYKEKFKQSNNSGEQSVGQNQVFEFQML